MASNPQYAAIMEKQGSGSEDSDSDSNSKNGLSLVEAGIIGAMTTLGAVLLLALFSWWAGVIAYGRNLNAKVHPMLVCHHSLKHRAFIVLFYLTCSHSSSTSKHQTKG